MSLRARGAGREKQRRDPGRAAVGPELVAGRVDICLREFCRAEWEGGSQMTRVDVYGNQ